MVTVSLPSRADDLAGLKDIKDSAKRLGITHDVIAEAAGVTRPMVVNVLAGRRTSRRVVDVIRRLIAAAERRQRHRRKAS